MEATRDEVSVREAARRFGVSTRTVHNMISDGRIVARRPTGAKRGMYRIPVAEIARHLAESEVVRHQIETGQLAEPAAAQTAGPRPRPYHGRGPASSATQPSPRKEPAMITLRSVWQDTANGDLWTVREIVDDIVFVESPDGRERTSFRAGTLYQFFVQI